MNLIGIDLPTPRRVEHSDEAHIVFPSTRKRTGVASNCSGRPDMCRVRIKGQQQFQTEARRFWRLRKE